MLDYNYFQKNYCYFPYKHFLCVIEIGFIAQQRHPEDSLSTEMHTNTLWTGWFKFGCQLVKDTKLVLQTWLFMNLICNRKIGI